MRPSKRLMLLPIGEDFITDMFCGPDNMFRTVRCNAPDGASVRGVHYNFEMKSFVVMLEHPSFNEVPEGCMIPYLPYTEHRVFEAKDMTEKQPTVAGSPKCDECNGTGKVWLATSQVPCSRGCTP